jgi:prepilin-type processing-associated H-X9-DG protein
MLFTNSHIRFVDVTDGLSNTIVVGERPPSSDERFGWWYAGVGQGDGSLDTHLSAQQVNRTFRAPTCPFGPYAYQSGSSSNLCDMFHFWSMHSQGANFLFADGGVRFLRYSIGPVLADLATRAGKETVILDP